MFASNKSLFRNQLICKYIIASPGNQVKKKINDFPMGYWLLKSSEEIVCYLTPKDPRHLLNDLSI